MSHFPIHNGSNQYPKTHSCIGQQEDSEGCGCGCLPPQIGLLSIQAMQQNFDTLAKHVQQIDAAMTNKLAHDDAMSQQLAILVSIPGIAATTALAMLIEMPELGTLDGKQAASLAGLAPISRQSGKWQGKEHIRGGRPLLRRAIYMPALVAVRFNPALKVKYDQLIQAGKPAKVALTAIMRKLIVMANALLRDRRKWAEISP